MNIHTRLVWSKSSAQKTCQPAESQRRLDFVEQTTMLRCLAVADFAAVHVAYLPSSACDFDNVTRNHFLGFWSTFDVRSKRCQNLLNLLRIVQVWNFWKPWFFQATWLTLIYDSQFHMMSVLSQGSDMLNARLTISLTARGSSSSKSASKQPGQHRPAIQKLIGQTWQGSFSAVSRPNFARKYALESSRRDLHNAVLCTALQSQFFSKLANIFLKRKIS